ncbi:hypothetical protein RHMOL_Rhmol04G0252400 [Rhododendron molle]|uniref:Uncharacterized protein n=1 Tax=Rhododendron molle TaxID=49168 RepID=A0ACC0P4K3_RHOML|nr:hypothetical protein RHMOL_Rhmol04G0252400 [Rhododendron molle]
MSLWLLGLMGKYCSKVDFVSSRPKPGCSWGWRSILWGKELLERGFKWRVGGRETASVFYHQWIPKISNPYLSVGLPVGVNYFQVKDLIDWDRLSWRRPLLEVLFPPDIVPNILAICVSQVKRGDELLWEHTKNGQYSVKLGYFSAYANSSGPLTDTIEVAVRSTYDAVCACQRVVCHAEVGVEVGGLEGAGCRIVVDGAWYKECWEGAIAWLLLGTDAVSRRSSKLKVYACSAFMVEAIAVLKALEWAKDRGWLQVEVLTDCLQVVSQLSHVKEADMPGLEVFEALGEF